MASTSWSYQACRGRRNTYTESKYVAGLRDLQRKTNWEDEELKQLRRHLEPLTLPERMEHLDILYQLPRNYVDYQPTKSRTRKRGRKTQDKELKITSNIEPWRFDIKLFMGNSLRVPVVGMHDEVYRLREVNDGISALMMRDGWCMSTISLIRHALHIPGLHLAMLLCPPTTRNPTERDHRQCAGTKCEALQVNRFTHTARHLHPGCPWQCKPIGADESKMDEILEEPDGIPRIIVPAFGALPARLEVVNNASYVAISHVWSHAFSYEPTENAMPFCQLERLRGFLNDLPGKIAAHRVWMDAFCIPERPSKPKAMSRIAKTFKQAEKIVVLDAKLLQSSCKASPFVQAIRILSSDWIRRLWTLEEAILGCANANMDKLYFRFSDGYVTLHTLLRELRSTQCPYSHSAVLGLERHLTFRLVPDWRTWSTPHNSVAARFAQLARALEYRNTSKRSDELMCMASILGLPTAGILDFTSPDDRAIAFYRTLKTVPFSILFCNGTRIPRYPFHWALASFISAEDPRKLHTLAKTTHRFGQVTPQGLSVRAEGLFFTFDPYQNLEEFNRIWIRDDRINLEPLCCGSARQIPPWQSWGLIKRARLQGQQLVLMINPLCDYEAIVLHYSRHMDQTCYVEYLTQVHVRYVGRRTPSDEGPLWRQGGSTSGSSPSSPEQEDEEGEESDDTNPLLARPWITGSNGERRSISASRQLRTSEFQKWIIS